MTLICCFIALIYVFYEIMSHIRKFNDIMREVNVDVQIISGPFGPEHSASPHLFLSLITRITKSI